MRGTEHKFTVPRSPHGDKAPLWYHTSVGGGNDGRRARFAAGNHLMSTTAALNQTRLSGFQAAEPPTLEGGLFSPGRAPLRCVLLLFGISLLSLFALPPFPQLGSSTKGLVIERYGDYPVIALDVQYARQGLLLTGPYSRFTFNHPSPFLAYWYAAIESMGVFGRGYEAYEWGEALWNLWWLGVAGAASWALTGTVVGGLAVYALAFTAFPIARPVWLTDLWGPATTLAPTLALILSVAAVLQGFPVFFLLASAAAYGAVTSHIGGVPMVGLVWGGGLVSFLRQTSSAGRRRVVIPFLIISAVFFALPALDALLNPGFGNLGKFLRFLSRPRATLGVVGAFEFLGTQLALGLPHLSAGMTPWWFFALACGVLFLAWRCRGAARDFAIVVALAGLGVLLASSRIVATPQFYLVWSVWSVIVAGMMTAVVAFLNGSWGKSRAARGVCGACAVLLWVQALTEVVRDGGSAFNPAPVLSLLETLPEPVEIRPAVTPEWDATAMVLRAVMQSGNARLRGSVCVPKKWLFMFRNTLACPAAPRSVLKAWRNVKVTPALLETLPPATVVRNEMLTVASFDPAFVASEDAARAKQRGKRKPPSYP